MSPPVGQEQRSSLQITGTGNSPGNPLRISLTADTESLTACQQAANQLLAKTP